MGVTCGVACGVTCGVACGVGLFTAGVVIGVVIGATGATGEVAVHAGFAILSENIGFGVTQGVRLAGLLTDYGTGILVIPLHQVMFEPTPL